MEVTLRPQVVVPDKDKLEISASELIDALNVRVGSTNPTGAPSIYKVAGSFLLTNPLLPEGTNKALCWCSDRVRKNLYWINWNETAQTIFKYNETDGFSVVLEMDLGLSADSVPTIAYTNNYLVWTSIDVPEPRQYNLEGTYVTPIEDWELYQIQHVPAEPLVVTAVISDVANYQPKPAPDTPNVGIQFAYNYEYQRGVEGRLSQPTQVYWNQTLDLTIPSSEITGFLQKAGASNPYIVAIRYYYRVGNTGDWTYFKRLKNSGLTPTDYDFTIDDIQILPTIGAAGLAALLAADGVPRYADDLLFADNRLILAKIKTGYDTDLPTATASLSLLRTDMDERKWRVFTPVPNQTILSASAFYDKQGRLIGTSPVNSISLSSVFKNSKKWQLSTISVYDYAGGGGFDIGALPWNQVVDYMHDVGGSPPQATPYSRNDISVPVPSIRITPNAGTLPAEVDRVELLSVNHFSFISYIRTQSRPFFIYKDGSDNFYPFLDKAAGESVVKGGTTLFFYGIGFEFASGEPIAFSIEQEYNVVVQGQLINSLNTVGPPYPNFMTIFSADAVFKITDQLGNILISRQPLSNPFWSAENFLSSVDAPNQIPLLGPYNHMTCDVVLYQKNISPSASLWNRVPNVSWTRDEWIALEDRFYDGDSYGTGDRKTMSGEGRTVYGFYFNGAYTQIGPLAWEGYFAAMNLNGIYQENWASDIGATTVLNEDPQEEYLENAIRHSESFLPNTRTNNIFTFNPLNQTQTQIQLGSITKLITLAVNNAFGNNAYAVCQNGVEMIFLGKTQQVGTDGNSVMSLNTRVFGSQNVLRNDYGAISKNDVVMTDVGLAFFFDRVDNTFVQISNNGLDPISIIRNFVSQCIEIEDGSIVGYDPLFKEAIVQAGGHYLFFYNLLLHIVQMYNLFCFQLFFRWIYHHIYKAVNLLSV